MTVRGSVVGWDSIGFSSLGWERFYERPDNMHLNVSNLMPHTGTYTYIYTYITYTTCCAQQVQLIKISALAIQQRECNKILNA